MLNGIKFVVKTTSNEERAELRELIFKDKLAASVMDDSDQVRYIAIYTGEVWFLSMIVASGIALSIETAAPRPDFTK